MPDKDKLDMQMFLADYLNDAHDGFQEAFTALLALEKDYSRMELLDDIFRPLHTLKSSSTMIEFAEIAETAHLAEELLQRMKNGEIQVTKETVDTLFSAVEILEAMVGEREKGQGGGVDHQAIATKMAELIQQQESYGAGSDDARVAQFTGVSIEKVETVRVHVNLLDSLFNMVGELIITKNRLDNIVGESERKDLKAVLADMKRIIDVLQENVSTARMVSVDEIFRKFPRMMRDLAKEQGKEVEFVMEGNDIEIDKGLIDSLGEPLLHLLRNAVDHGIEPVEERQAQGKKDAGLIRLIARRTENQILIDVEDDGRGVDLGRMKGVAVSKGFARQEEIDQMSERELLSLLFRPGLSTVDHATGVSGRGVGLDVVLTSARKMGGLVDIATSDSGGSRFSLKLPLTTALIQTLMVAVGESIFAIPSDIVLETLEVAVEEIREIGADQVLTLRNEVIPFLRLAGLLNMPQKGLNESRTESAIIIQDSDRYVAVGVDAVLNQMENIIKPFDPIARQFKGFSGGIILGDGRVSLLLDIPALINAEISRKEKQRHE